MLKKIILSFSLAQQNIRGRLLHTLLSILGIVIGVGALVAVLSLIDGMEKYARDQITTTTSLKAVMITTQTHKRVNDVQLQKETYNYLNYARFKELATAITFPATGYMEFSQNGEVVVAGKRIGASVKGINALHPTDAALHAGRMFTTQELAAKNNVAFVNHSFAAQATGKNSVDFILGKTISYKGKTVKVIGILKAAAEQKPEVYLPVTLFSEAELKADPPLVIFEVENVENVQAFKAQTESWLKTNFKGDPTDFKVITNEGRVKQAAQGFLLFRVIMGFIVGISVIVGGVGVMNVLLISVTERTVEIGVRKAMGARRRDILLQFLAESVTVSLFGSFLGLVLGVVSTFAFVPLIKSMAGVPFEAAYTLNTFVLISVIAIVIGIIFGTYPALRASRLDPVEAIRRE